MHRKYRHPPSGHSVFSHSHSLPDNAIAEWKGWQVHDSGLAIKIRTPNLWGVIAFYAIAGGALVYYVAYTRALWAAKGWSSMTHVAAYVYGIEMPLVLLLVVLATPRVLLLQNRWHRILAVCMNLSLFAAFLYARFAT